MYGSSPSPDLASRASCTSVPRAGGSQLLVRSLVAEIREPQQQSGRTGKCQSNPFRGPASHRPGQHRCEAAEKPAWAANPGDPPSTRFHDRSAARIVMRSPPHGIENPNTHAQRHYYHQHPYWRKTKRDQNRRQRKKRENHQAQLCVQAAPLLFIFLPAHVRRPHSRTSAFLLDRSPCRFAGKNNYFHSAIHIVSWIALYST